MEFDDFIKFRWFITPPAIVIIYILGVIAITLFSLAMMLGGLVMPQVPSYGTYPTPNVGGWVILMGLLMLVIGNVLWRMWCEYIIILFKIHESLVTIESNVQKTP